MNICTNEDNKNYKMRGLTDSIIVIRRLIDQQ